MANTTAVLTPNSLSDMGVEAELKLRVLNKKLEIESLTDDIFEQLGSNIVSTGQNVAIPNSIYMKLEATPTGARQVTVPLLMNLTGAPTIGGKTPVGAEAKQNLKRATFYYDEYSYAVASTNWGTTHNDMAVYGVFEKIQPQISLYMKELRGQRIREALLLTHCSVLTGAASPVQLPSWNKNWFVANTNVGAQPVFDQSTDDFADAISTVMAAADTGTSGVDANIDLQYLRALEYYATNVLRIDPIQVGGKDTYVVTIPSPEVYKLKSDTTGQLGSIYTEMVRKTEDTMEYTGALGRVGKLLLIEDQRYPVITATYPVGGGTPAPGTLDVDFVQPGNEDARPKGIYDTSTNPAWNIGFLIGKGALVEWVVKELHFEIEKQNYGRDQGTGAFGESGISIVEYDVDAGWATVTSPTANTTRENSGSIVLAWTSPSIAV